MNTEDIYGKNASEMKNCRLFLLDMDGTIYKENSVFEGTRELLYHIDKIGGKYVFITNNSSRSVYGYIEKLDSLGIKSDEENFFTSTQASILYIKKLYNGEKIYAQGTRTFIQELRESGLDVTEEPEAGIGVVLVGFDNELTSSKLRKTCKVLSENDIPFIATNPDLRCPVSFGFIPDCGSICQMITNATDKTPIYIGKPEPAMVDIVRNKYGYSREETVVIGDRLYTDIAAGINSGVMSVCVLTGETKHSDIENGEIKPSFTFRSVKEILTVLRS